MNTTKLDACVAAADRACRSRTDANMTKKLSDWLDKQRHEIKQLEALPKDDFGPAQKSRLEELKHRVSGYQSK